MNIINGKIFDVKKGQFEEKNLWVNGKYFGTHEQHQETDVVLDCKGSYITPGLIDAHSHLGMWEESIGVEGADGNEVTDPITPHLRAIDAINPMDEAFREALSGGVTTVSTGPGSTNVIGGTFAIIKTHGNVIDEMVVKESAAMKCAFGENPKKYYGAEGKAPKTRMGIAGMMRGFIMEALDYQERKEAATRPGERPAYNAKIEAFLPVLRREIPMKAHAHRADDIATMIRIGKEFNLDVTLDHCTEGHLITDHIKKSGYHAIVGPSFGFKTKVELSNKTFDTPRVLIEAGIKTAIMTDHPVNPQSSLILWAIFAHRAGLSQAEALRAVTLYPAEILGIADRVGSVEEGKEADFVVWDKHPMDAYARVQQVFIAGEEVYHMR